MTKRVHINQCLESGCQSDGGPRLLCAIHAPAYQPIIYGPEPDQVAEQERAMAVMDAMTPANDPGEVIADPMRPFTDDVDPLARDKGGDHATLP